MISDTLVEFDKAIELSRDRSLDTWDKLVQRVRLHKAARPEPTSTPRGDASASIPATPSKPAMETPPALTLTQISAAPEGETRADRVYRLAALFCHFYQYPKGTLQRVTTGVGWFLEPLVDEKFLAAKQLSFGSSMVQMHTWNVMAMLSGQWHRDVYPLSQTSCHLKFVALPPLLYRV